MVKEMEIVKEKSKVNWLSDFTESSLDKSAEIEIKPKLTIDNLGLEFAKKVLILSEPYLVEIPKEKAIGNTNKIWMIDLEYNNVAHTFICQSGSFRFQLGVIMKKLGLEKPSGIIGLYIRIWKAIANIKTPSFTGKAEVYQVKLV